LEDEGLVIDSENDECNSEDEETFMHETYKRVEYPSNPKPIKIKCAWTLSVRRPLVNHVKAVSPIRNRLSPTFRKTSMPSIRVWWIKNILVEKLTRNPKISLF
jgi:hypothetical protein